MLATQLEVYGQPCHSLLPSCALMATAEAEAAKTMMERNVMIIVGASARDEAIECSVEVLLMPNADKS